MEFLNLKIMAKTICQNGANHFHSIKPSFVKSCPFIIDPVPEENAKRRCSTSMETSGWENLTETDNSWCTLAKCCRRRRRRNINPFFIYGRIKATTFLHHRRQQPWRTQPRRSKLQNTSRSGTW